MDRLQGLIGIIAIMVILLCLSNAKRSINWRTLGVGFALQISFALLVLKWEPGFLVLKKVSEGLEKLIGFSNAGTSFVFGGLFGEKNGFVFALNVLPVVIFLGAIIGALYYLRVLQWFVEIVGSALNKILGTSKVESVWASTVIFLGMAEAPLVIRPWIPQLTRSELFACMSGGFASVAGSTLVGYSLLGAPLPYLLAASVMNAPGSLIVAKALMPETEESRANANIRTMRDEHSENLIDAIGAGALSGGRIAVTIGCLLIAFIATITMLSAVLGGVGSVFGQENWSLEGLFGLIFAPLAWAIGVPWDEASLVGNFIGQKTILNEFVGYTAFSEYVDTLSEKSILISSFALAGFANLGSIAIQIGAFGALAPERRAEVASLGLKALFAGFCTNMLNAAIVGVIVF
ncbi:NupC/NupG family nucleoside CNT transporter [Corynebacterium sp. ES2794-CONJ1]|uniref:NupC/NupG family nucleoside CNT transporter n=1 Tax=unclassified Corynebacterium TaxID=2624378 RepID=UPI002168CD3C|nr:MULTISPECIES: nucleoside transporter C-terminal domain-containing protein [unclassified Corynebacterium]MCS4491939.1 NupC/NupG family nucleoside CNT transporter [Corynebacterium sp. ES2715-CONJ3]MCS4532044.1 NupC/NupG family nucleoside CNT transporter [Corynebacterium sp. ES2730-CONJ]MCU9519445.1 NupC/NupG family nucleoside CNT transporter [Corynebacterium sp. ES2794-CONJ1]